jgi:hypothetical protein
MLGHFLLFKPQRINTKTQTLFPTNLNPLKTANLQVKEDIVCKTHANQHGKNAIEDLSTSARVGVPGDVSSSVPGAYDQVCNMKDVAHMVALFNTRPTSPNWNPTQTSTTMPSSTCKTHK